MAAFSRMEAKPVNGLTLFKKIKGAVLVAGGISISFLVFAKTADGNIGFGSQLRLPYLVDEAPGLLEDPDAAATEIGKDKLSLELPCTTVAINDTAYNSAAVLKVVFCHRGTQIGSDHSSVPQLEAESVFIWGTGWLELP